MTGQQLFQRFQSPFGCAAILNNELLCSFTHQLSLIRVRQERRKEFLQLQHTVRIRHRRQLSDGVRPDEGFNNLAKIVSVGAGDNTSTDSSGLKDVLPAVLRNTPPDKHYSCQ